MPPPTSSSLKQGLVDAISLLFDLNVLLVLGTARISTPPICQEEAARVRRCIKDVRAKVVEPQPSHEGPSGSPPSSCTRLDSSHDSTSCIGTRPSTRIGTPSRGLLGTLMNGTLTTRTPSNLELIFALLEQHYNNPMHIWQLRPTLG